MRIRPMKRIGAGLAVACAMLTSSVHAASPSQPALIAIESDNSVAMVFACFSRNASFPSFAYLDDRNQDGSAVYRLRFERDILEDVQVRPTASGGSRIEIVLSRQYGERDIRAFRAKRGGVLAACAVARASSFAQVTQQVQP